MKQYTLHKGERLKKRNDIEHLFHIGKSFGLYPLRIYYLQTPKETETPEGEHVLKAGFAVSKRYFKKAVDRNRIKRLIKEGYRLQKLPLQEAVENSGTALHLFFIYTGKDLPHFNLIKEKINAILHKLHAEFIKHPR